MIRCLIVDDEPIAIRVLNAHLVKIPDVEVAASCTNPIEALRIIKTDVVDLVFLDIEMPELTGIGFVESLTRPPGIVFTTAHRDYAARGFDLDAVDYLLKPISFPRLLRAVEKYRRLESAAQEPVETTARAMEPINIQVDRRTVRIDPHDVKYIESLSDYVIIHTRSDKFTTKLRISDLEEQLAPHGFARIHRSYLAPLRDIRSFTSTEVQLSDTVLPVSRTYRREVMKRLRDTDA